MEALKNLQAVDERVAADLLGVGLQTLRNNRSLGVGIPYVRVGKRSIRYLVSDIEDFLQKNRIVPQAN